MEKYINTNDKECYKGVTRGSIFDAELFHVVDNYCKDNISFALHTNIGSLTVLNRMTGFGWRDTETGFRDVDGKFWLASGGRDVRDSNVDTIGEAIDWVKENANTCIGV